MIIIIFDTIFITIFLHLFYILLLDLLIFYPNRIILLLL